MNTRYYRFFAIMRQAILTNNLEFSAPGNKMCVSVLNLMREKGLISGYCLDFDRNNKREGYWTGYPRYKVYLKYNYFGIPVIKKLNFSKLTRTNFLRVKEEYPKLATSNYWLVYNKQKLELLTSLNKTTVNAVVIAKIMI